MFSWFSWYPRLTFPVSLNTGNTMLPLWTPKFLDKRVGKITFWENSGKMTVKHELITAYSITGSPPTAATKTSFMFGSFLLA